MGYEFVMDIQGSTDQYWLNKRNEKVAEMGLKGRMKNLYKLGCVLDLRKPGDRHLACGRHKPFKDDRFDWCDNCMYSKGNELWRDKNEN